MREIYDDGVEELLILNHLLFSRRLESMNINDSNFSPDTPFIPCYRHVNKSLNHFWKRWTKEYLATIRDFDITIGDIVLIAHNKMPRQIWRFGHMLKVFTSRGNNVGAAEVKVGKTEHIIQRPVNKLYPLNLNPHEEQK